MTLPPARREHAGETRVRASASASRARGGERFSQLISDERAAQHDRDLGLRMRATRPFASSKYWSEEVRRSLAPGARRGGRPPCDERRS